MKVRLRALPETPTDELAALYLRVREAWSAETASTPDAWDEDNPACDQCHVTAMVVQDIFGGDIYRGHVYKRPQNVHYWNVLPNGKVADLTREQFPEGTIFVGEKVSRSWLVSMPAVWRGYRNLVKAIRLYQTTEERRGAAA